jgi:FAD/FMN-containing dehydrogenase
MKKLVTFLSLSIFLSSFTYAAETFNDVSRLNPTIVTEVFQPRTIEDIRGKILEAQKRNLKVSIAGKRHSQGGQQSCENCIVLDMLSFNKILSLDTNNGIIRVQSGVTWDQIQRYINSHGFSIKVMQTSNIFTIGGSLSANVHGQDFHFGDMGNTIRSFRLLLADGTIVNVSREENSDLFRLVIGGFGLFGVVLDVDIELTKNIVYEKKSEIMSYRQYSEYFKRNVENNPDIGLHFADLSISPGDNFLEEMIVTSYQKSAKDLSRWTLNEEKHAARNRFLLGLSRKYSWGKRLRWYMQKVLRKGDKDDQLTSRNNAMRNPIKFLEYYSSTDTDILQEYFVPIDRFTEFVDGLREIVLKNKVNLLHVGIRHIPKDNEGYLSYALKDSIALVFYINQKVSDQGKEEARSWTRQLVDLALKCEGTYYLVYQLYPTAEQLRKAYPNIDEFFKKKRVYDPQLRFMNKFYETYARN